MPKMPKTSPKQEQTRTENKSENNAENKSYCVTYVVRSRSERENLPARDSVCPNVRMMREQSLSDALDGQPFDG